MAGPFLSVGELSVGRAGTPFSADARRDYTRRFRVRVTDKGMGPLAVCSCPDLPLPYSPYLSGGGTEWDLRALLTRMSAEQEGKDEGDWVNWVVTCQYSTDVGRGANNYGFPNRGGQTAANNPELELPQILWEFQEVKKSPQKDLDNRAFLNSAQQPMKPAPQVEHAYPVLNYSRNQLSFSVQNAVEYSYAVNAATFLGVPPWSAQCLPPRAELKYLGSLSYWRVTYKIRFAPLKDDGTYETWQPRYLDEGMNEQWGADLVPIKNGPHPISQPVCLNGNGKRLTLGATPFYNEFRVYRGVGFGLILQQGL